MSTIDGRSIQPSAMIMTVLIFAAIVDKDQLYDYLVWNPDLDRIERILEEITAGSNI